MRKILLIPALAVMAMFGTASSADAAGASVKAPAQEWGFQGLTGGFDRGALKRGLQVYTEVCASCHGLNLVSYRHLAGIGMHEDDIKALAANYEVEDGPNDEGDMFMRTAKASDRFVSPFPNDNAAKAANNGALPPDLSLMVKARVDGANYLYALMTGYKDEAPEGFSLGEGQYYNTYFPGHAISMAPPIGDDAVEYADGTPATKEQIARDIVEFLAWTASPELEERKRMGVKVMIFLIVLTGLMYLLKRRIWSDLH